MQYQELVNLKMRTLRKTHSSFLKQKQDNVKSVGVNDTNFNKTNINFSFVSIPWFKTLVLLSSREVSTVTALLKVFVVAWV